MIYAIIGIFTVVGTSVGFYYNTKAAINDLTKEQVRLDDRQFQMEEKCIELNEKKIDKDDYIRELDEVKYLLRDMNQKIDKVYGIQ